MLSSSSSSPPAKPSHPRAPAKSTPFAAVAAGVAGGAAEQSSRSRLQRTAMTASLRKARRGHTVARKRHVRLGCGPSHLPPPAMGSATPLPGESMEVQMQRGNPYSRGASHVRETIEVATSVVRVCSQDQNEASMPSLLSLIDKMCVLLTPDDVDNIISSTGRKSSASLNSGPAAGASYDSSMAAMAANSLLAQFLEVNSTQSQGPQYSRENNLAFLLADALAYILKQTTDTRTPILQTVQIKAVIALNQLAATEPPPPLESAFNQDQFSPYGHPQSASPSEMIASTPASWCFVLVQSRSLSALVHHIPSPTAVGVAVNLELCEKCVGVMGNLAGDSEAAREALRDMGALPKLIGCLSWGMSPARRHNSTDRSMIDLIRNCVWSLSNLFRDGGTLPAVMFRDVHDDPQFTTYLGRLRLSPGDVAALLAAPELFPSQADGGGMDTTTATETTMTTWMDVTVETCWLVSFLTKDPIAVGFFCGSGGRDGQGPVVISALVSRLVRATDAAGRRLDSTSNVFGEDSGCLIPCCRALKNMAVAQDGRYMSSIFLAEIYDWADTPESTVHPVGSSLAKLISFGALGGGSELSMVASEAAATAGAFLYDVTLHQPATCRALVAALCRALVCPLTAFDFRREVACALWTAVEIPPGYYAGANGAAANAEAVQKEICQVILTSPSEIARALTAMLSALDTDAVYASLCLIDHLLRRLDATIQLPKIMSILFEEVGLVDALWRICDDDSNESATAEVAAGILDDFYEQEEEEEVDESLGPASSSGQFQFQAPSTDRIPAGGFNFGAAEPLQQVRHAPPLMGRGRGRGQVLPSWMQQQQQQQL